MKLEISLETRLGLCKRL